jgi:hypothetical protein
VKRGGGRGGWGGGDESASLSRSNCACCQSLAKVTPYRGPREDCARTCDGKSGMHTASPEMHRHVRPTHSPTARSVVVSQGSFSDTTFHSPTGLNSATAAVAEWALSRLYCPAPQDSAETASSPWTEIAGLRYAKVSKET